MKKVLLVLMLSAVSLSMFAQEPREFRHIVGLSPFQLLSGVRVKYETPLNDRFSVGGLATFYYGNFPGFQLAPQARFFFRENAPEGFYAQAKLVAGFHSLRNAYPSVNFSSFGAGVALGYQVFFGRDRRWTFDVNLGLKGVGGPPSQANEWAEDAVNTTVWFLTGPGSIIDGLISIGYRF